MLLGRPVGRPWFAAIFAAAPVYAQSKQAADDAARTDAVVKQALAGYQGATCAISPVDAEKPPAGRSRNVQQLSRSRFWTPKRLGTSSSACHA